MHAGGWIFLTIIGQSWLRDQDFWFWAKSKNSENPKCPRIGIWFWKSRKNPEWKNPENPEIREIGIGIWKSRKNPENLKILNPLILGIRDFSEFRDFYPRDFRKLPGIQDCLSGIPEIFSWDRFFFVGWDIPTKIYLWS